MGKNSFFKRNWRTIVTIATIVALIVLLIAIREQIVETFNNLGKVNIWILLLLIPLTIVGYHAQTKIYQDLFGILGNKLKYWFLFRVTLELNFVNTVFPSGGVSGISYFGVRMRGQDISATRASLVQMIRLLLVFGSFEILLVLGLLAMAIGGQANDLVILVAGSISTLLVVGTFAFLTILRSETRIHATFTFITNSINKFVHFFRRNHPETISTARAEGIVRDLHENYKTIEDNYKQLRGTFLWALLLNVSAVLSIYVVYIAFDAWVNLGAIILAYSVANFAGLVSVLPGGVGIYEFLMTGVLAAAGVPAALSLPVTVMYRVISTLIQAIPGYILYHKTINQNNEQAAEIRHQHE